MKPPIDKFSNLRYPHGQVTQGFGENPELYARFGMKAHNGVDYVAPHGSPMYAIEDATVAQVKDDPSGFGKHIRLITTNKRRKEQHEWTYGHCDTILVKQGDTVEAGEQIATMGNTGFVVSGATPWWEHNPFAGTHLHLGLRKVVFDDTGWRYKGSRLPKMNVKNYNNGFKGAIDPMPLLQFENQDPRIPLMLTVISLQKKLVGILKGMVK